MSAFELRHLARRVRMERQPMEPLMLLVERRGELVTRDDIAGRPRILIFGHRIVSGGRD